VPSAAARLRPPVTSNVRRQRSAHGSVHERWKASASLGGNHLQPVGRIRGSKAFGTDGRYVGTIVGDRLVYRSTDSASIGSPFTAAHRAGSARANRAGSAILGDEPDIPD
jgi:hypothetical protein